MMRMRAVNLLRIIARDGVRSKTALPMATDHLTLANGSGLTTQQRLGLARHRCSAAGTIYTLHPTSNHTGGVGALPLPVKHRFHSPCCCPLLSRADGDARHVERATARCLRSAASPRKMSTLAGASSKVGSATANDITFETGKIAQLADGFVTARQGGTVVMVSAVSNRAEMDDSGFLPLSVDYREKAHALGKIPRTPNRRDGRETDEEVLVARAVDRVLRPLFPPGYCFDTQVVATVQALEAGGDPVVVAINAASAALCVSNIPWDGPAGCVRIGRVDGKLVVNPSPDTFSPTAWNDGGGFDLLYAANEHRVLMIEMGGGPTGERLMNSALKLAHKHVAPLIEAQRALQRDAGKEKVLPRSDAAPSPGMLTEAMRVGLPDAKALFAAPPKGGDDATAGESGNPSKADRGRAEGALLGMIRKALATSFPDAPPAARVAAAEAVLKRAMRAAIVEEGRRPDGRGIDETRDLTGEVDVLPTVHGSGIFTRGQTQTLATVTLGPALESAPQRFLGKAQEAPDMLDARLYLHYEFPPYCVNETGRVGLVNRRMVGHGNLAERAVLSVMPETETFPYTTRVSAEVTMSNGSSSMATACATSLALMDAGVPVSSPVGGISVGLMTTDAPADGEDIGPHSILMDIQGTEDHYGDMDFKVAGTATGITAIQLDVKLRGGVPLPVLSEALRVAKAGRAQVLKAMKKAIGSPNGTLKDRAPRCEIVHFEADRKKDLVGFQGQTMKGIEESFGVALDLSTEGRAVVFSDSAQSVAGAVKLVRELVHEIEEGDFFEGTVKTVHEYGCLVELLRNQQGLLHVSNMTDKLPAPPARDIVKVGDTVDVRVMEVDRLRGLIKLASESHPSSSTSKPGQGSQSPTVAGEDEEMQKASQ
ncbi:unnamed protein product [Ectocarpus sp. 4 AP-2014]